MAGLRLAWGSCLAGRRPRNVTCMQIARTGMYRPRVEALRIELAGSAATTIHVACHSLAHTGVTVATVNPAEPLDRWCARNGVPEAISGGFTVKPDGIPLGYLRTAGQTQEHRPFRAPWHDVRGCLSTKGGVVKIAPPTAVGGADDVLQAGPLLVCDGRPALAASDPEGFSTTCQEFDQDLTDGREPRAAIALAGDTLMAVAADGRGAEDAGLTLWELAEVLVDLGADVALNLDGGSAAALVSDGRLRNTPRDDDGERLEHPSEASTTLVFGPRA